MLALPIAVGDLPKGEGEPRHLHEGESNPDRTGGDALYFDRGCPCNREERRQKIALGKLPAAEVVNQDDIDGSEDREKRHKVRRQILIGLHVADIHEPELNRAIEKKPEPVPLVDGLQS